MDKEIINSYSKLNSLNVSRETYLDFESYISMIIKKNKEINLISEKNAQNSIIRRRHIIDSAQIIDFIDLNSNTTTDLGSGGGMPGIIVAIILKSLKKDMKVQLYEKSYHKSNFLREVSKKLDLKTEIFQKNIFEIKKLETGTIMSRAFKPLPIVLNLVYENTAHAIEQRSHFLKSRNIGVCDIVAAAQREKVDASDLGMQEVELRNLVGFLKEFPQIHTLIFTGGASKNGPEYFFRKQLKHCLSFTRPQRII